MIQERVAVLMGGPSSEHGVSLASGKEVLHTLRNTGHDAFPVHIDERAAWSVPVSDLKQQGVVAFITLRGAYGEDGTIQEILRNEGIPFTGSDVLPSALGMHKVLTSKLFYAHGFEVPPTIEVHRNAAWPDLDEALLPGIVKPAEGGSSLGVSIVRFHEDIPQAIERAFEHSRTALVQPFIQGREVSVTVLDDAMGNVFALPPIEITPNTGDFYDHVAKYAPRGADHTLFEPYDDLRRPFLMDTAISLHRLIGAENISRSDMILGDDGTLYILEINTAPDLTATSVTRKAVRAHGMEFLNLLEHMVAVARRTHEARNVCY